MNCDGCHGGAGAGWVGPRLSDGRWRFLIGVGVTLDRDRAEVCELCPLTFVKRQDDPLSVYYSRPNGVAPKGCFYAVVGFSDPSALAL